MKQEGYAQKQFGIKTKRFCQTLDLKDEPELMAAYKQLHDEGLTEVNGIQWIKAGKKVIDIYNNLLNH